MYKGLCVLFASLLLLPASIQVYHTIHILIYYDVKSQQYRVSYYYIGIHIFCTHILYIRFNCFRCDADDGLERVLGCERSGSGPSALGKRVSKKKIHERTCVYINEKCVLYTITYMIWIIALARYIRFLFAVGNSGFETNAEENHMI